MGSEVQADYPTCREQLFYDNAGNRTRRVTEAVEQLYTYDSNNRLSELKEIAGRPGKEAGTVSQPEVKVQKFTYDRQGNLLQDGNARYQYDAFGRMEQAETATGMIQKNRYDAEGLRHEVEENGALIQFLYSGEEVVAATKEGEGTTRYIRGYGLISSDSEQARTYYHYVSDEKGSVTHLVSSEGEGVLNEYSYDVFGNRTVLKEAVDNLFGYTGQQYDGITGQYYLRARYYNPVIGRFIQEDTYYGDGLNLYAYCCNNPVMYYDPTGHEHEANHNRGGADGADGSGYNPEWGDPDFADRYRDHRYEYDYYAGEDAKKQQQGKGGTDSPIRKKPEADVPDDKPSQGGSSSKTYMTGKDGEKELANMYGGQSQAYFKTSKGKRFVDQLADGIAHESKVGYTTLTERVKMQILKDAELIKTGQIKGAHWHFFTSGVTGKGGASQPLLDFLSQNGIKYTIH